MLLIAFGIMAYSVYFIQNLAKDIKQQEADRVKNYALAIESISTSKPDADVSFQLMLIENNKENKSIPVILADSKGNVIDHINVLSKKDSTYNIDDVLKNKLILFKKINEPIKIATLDPQYMYFGQSNVLQQLSYFPYVLFAIIILFFAIVFIAYNSANKSLQNRVWVGMSKETAHQLGTPLMSMVGWLEYLRSNGQTMVADEMDKDVERLKLIAERFSKIGSKPDLVEENLAARLENVIDYMQRRCPKQVKIIYNNTNNDIPIMLNGPLFDWVIENLIRNSLDAMAGKGNITITVQNKPAEVIIDVADNGKGMPKNVANKVFKPGFTTKQRGWGLGLSLAKRIVTKYHHGHINVLKSAPNEGTTFRIILDR